MFVLSSNYEGWGRTIVEAMSAGVPIVATDVGCVGSFFRPQIDGRVVQPNDPAGLAAAIEEQIKEPERREWMRQQASERAKEFPSQEELHNKQMKGWRVLICHSEGSRSDEESSTWNSRRDSNGRSFTFSPRFDLWVIGLILFTIAVRALSVALFHSSLLNREWGFFTLVQHWFQGYGYSYATELGCASAYRSPGYLFFLTALYSVFRPENTLAQAIVQNIFIVGIIWLVYAVGKRLVGKRAALVGAFLMAVYPYTFYHYTQYYHTFLSSFFLLLMAWFVLRLAESKRKRDAIGTGLSIGALAYVQGTILVAAPLIVLWLFWKWKFDWKRTLVSAILMAVFSAGLIAPWTYRNWKELHTFVPLTTDLGHALFKSNNEVIYELTKRGYPQEIVDLITVSSTDSEYKQYRMPLEIEDKFKRDGVFRDSIYWTEWHPKEPNGIVDTCRELGPLNEVEFNRYWTEKANTWMKENFWTEGWKLHLLKLKTFWQPALFPSVKTGAPWSFAGNPIKVWLARNAMTFASAVVIFGGLIGIIYAIRRRDRSVWLPIIILFVYSLLHTFFAGYTKYRIPLDNLLAIYAGWTIIALWDKFRGLYGKDTSSK
jgi:4-amino-4-deoxy-L-arabinose transferase-like glycosyltransferase